MVKYDFPTGHCGKDNFPPPTDNSDVTVESCAYHKQKQYLDSEFIGAESRTCKQSSIANTKANRIRFVCLGKTLPLGVHEPLITAYKITYFKARQTKAFICESSLLFRGA